MVAVIQTHVNLKGKLKKSGWKWNARWLLHLLSQFVAYISMNVSKSDNVTHAYLITVSVKVWGIQAQCTLLGRLWCMVSQMMEINSKLLQIQLKKTWIKNIFSFRRNPMKRSKPIINWSFYVCIHRLINLSPVCHWAPLLCKNYETHINESHCRTERHVLLCHELMHWEFILTKPFMQHAANRNTLILMKHQMWMNTLLKIVPGTISSCLLKTENFYMLS